MDVRVRSNVRGAKTGRHMGSDIKSTLGGSVMGSDTVDITNSASKVKDTPKKKEFDEHTF